MPSGFGHLASQGSTPVAGALDRIFLHLRDELAAITPSQPSPIEGEGFQTAHRIARR
jgi:hypothetical protein